MIRAATGDEIVDVRVEGLIAMAAEMTAEAMMVADQIAAVPVDRQADLLCSSPTRHRTFRRMPVAIPGAIARQHRLTTCRMMLRAGDVIKMGVIQPGVIKVAAIKEGVNR